MLLPILQPGGVAEDNAKDVVEVVRDSARKRAEAFHLLGLDKLLFEPFPLGVVEEISFQLGQLAGSIESSEKPCGHIQAVSVSLPHLELGSLQTVVRFEFCKELNALLLGVKERE